MAKDPAFLFYPGDWLGGTMLLTRHQKGCYIDLLMAQFNFGPLSLDHIKVVLGQDQAVWTVLQGKFLKDNSGNFYNEKLANEIAKRKNFTASRSNNKSGRKSYDKSHDNHMNNHMENGNRNDNLNDLKGGVGEKQIKIDNNILPFPFSQEIKDIFLLYINMLKSKNNNVAKSTAGQELYIRDLIEYSGGNNDEAMRVIKYSLMAEKPNLYPRFKNQKNEGSNKPLAGSASDSDYYDSYI